MQYNFKHRVKWAHGTCTFKVSYLYEKDLKASICKVNNKKLLKLMDVH